MIRYALILLLLMSLMASAFAATPMTNQSILKTSFQDDYSDIPGVLTFRGSAHRDAPAYGTAVITKNKLEKSWQFQTGSRSWGGGAGWTGQASIIEWPDSIKQIMNLKPEYQSKSHFKEVVYASLDGRVYFLDLETGKQTRPVIDVKNPIKGSLSLDPRGYPILYVGQGINETGEFKYRIFSLINGQLLYSINGIDPVSKRGRWGAFDGSALIDGEHDRLLLGGENGIFYEVKLNTRFHLKSKELSVDPIVKKYMYNTKNQGIENSVAVHNNIAYFSDNGGLITALDLHTFKPMWTFTGNDDTDATLVIRVENDVPYLYTGNEVDKQGPSGKVFLRKINGNTGQIMWEKAYKCFYSGGKKPVNGGLLATPAMGKADTEGMIFFSLARYGTMSGGLMLALDVKTGAEIWRKPMKHYFWSSPVLIQNQNKQTVLLQGDSVGNLFLIKAKTGELLDQIQLNGNIEASPAVFDNQVIVATRAGSFYGLNVK